jgi:hypothetical protein
MHVNWAVYLRLSFPTMYSQYLDDLEKADTDEARLAVESRWCKIACRMIGQAR